MRFEQTWVLRAPWRDRGDRWRAERAPPECPRRRALRRATRRPAGFICGAGAIPRRSRRGYAPSQRQFPTGFSETVYIYCRRTGYDPSVAERPKTSGSSVRPHWKQGVPHVGIKRRTPDGPDAIDILPALKRCLLPTNRVVVGIDDFGQNLDIYGGNTLMSRFWRSWLPVFSNPRLPRSPPDSLLTSIF